MRTLLFFAIAAAPAFVMSACSKSAETNKADTETQAKIDACTLLAKQEVEALQGSPITDTKSSENTGGEFRLAQCFYTAAEFNKSISIAVAQKDPANPQSRTPKQFWHETFDRSGEKNKKDEKEGEEKEPRMPPKKIGDLGDDAYWVPNRFGGILYVLKDGAFISVSVGGTDNEQTKLDKCKVLAQKVVNRL